MLLANDLVVDAKKKITRKYSHIGTSIPQYTVEWTCCLAWIFLFTSEVQKGELTALV